RVCRAPIHSVGLWYEGARHPAAAAAGAPGIVAIARLGCVITADRIELPLHLAGRGVDAIERALAGPFAALAADDDHALGVERRAGEPDRQLLGILQLGVPSYL